jgi:hypothetical protein
VPNAGEAKWSRDRAQTERKGTEKGRELYETNGRELYLAEGDVGGWKEAGEAVVDSVEEVWAGVAGVDSGGRRAGSLS